MHKIILASGSEQRAKILSDCGIAYDKMISGVPEIMDNDMDISVIVEKNAEMKACDIAEKAGKGRIVIGADTLVQKGRHLIGKPASMSESRSILDKFSGKIVEVHTGLCVIDTTMGKRVSGSERSIIHVSRLTDDEKEKMFGLLVPYDKAGGFTVEGVGSMIFDDIDGSFYNILGLPMVKLRMLFKEIGSDILDFVSV